MDRGEDTRYLESQVLGDQEADADMDAIEDMTDYEFMNFEYMDKEDDSQEDEEEVKEAYTKPKKEKGEQIHLGFVDPEEDSDDHENSESIQAQGYDRTFIVSGPVVKVYKKGDY